MKTKLSPAQAIAISAVAASFSGAAFAQSLPAPGQSEDGWRHTIAAYAFLPLRTRGTSTIAGGSADVDLDLGEVLDLLDFAAAGRYEAWNGDFGLIFDANYAGIGGAGALPGPLGSGIEVTSRQKWLGVLGAYRVADGTYGASNQRFTFDVQGGVRLNSIKQTIDITTPGPGVPPRLGGDESWFEPVIGARGMWRLNDEWSTVASMDLGGFGAGGNDLQIGANIGFDYQPWDNTALTFGYRYFSVDYSDTLADGEFAYDMVQHGPYLGLKYFFN